MNNLARQLAAVQKFVLREHSGTVAGVAGTRTLSRGKRLGIYRDAYFLRLHEVLSSAFAALKTVLGDPRFDEAIAAYTARTRSHHFSIRYYGDGLAKFLATDRRFKHEPALAEVAALEWLMAHAFDAADATPIEMAALAAVPPHSWAEVSFELHTSIKTLTARWNSVAMWQAANRGEPIPAQTKYPRALTWVVWRRGLDVLYEKVGNDERKALRLALKGETFGAICECAPVALPDAERAAWAVQSIQRWVARGWIVGLTTP